MPLHHVALRVSDLDRSRTFYLATLKPLGYKVFMESDKFVGLSVYSPDFWLYPTKVSDKAGSAEPVKPQGIHVAFGVSSQAKVKQFYEAALYIYISSIVWYGEMNR